jgi:anthranilate phosphoribosyltransferase
VVLLNAAAALVAGGKTQTMREGIDLAAESIDSGAAMNVLENLVAFTQNVAPV